MIWTVNSMKVIFFSVSFTALTECETCLACGRYLVNQCILSINDYFQIFSFLVILMDIFIALYSVDHEDQNNPSYHVTFTSNILFNVHTSLSQQFHFLILQIN